MRAEPTIATFLSSGMMLLGLPVRAGLERAAEERRKSGSEDDPDIGKLRARHNPLADHYLGRVDERLHELAAEPGKVGMLGGNALLRFALVPGVEPRARLAAELALGDEFGEPALGRHGVSEFLRDRRAD